MKAETLLKSYQSKLDNVQGQLAQARGHMDQLEQQIMRLTAVEQQLIGAVAALGQVNENDTTPDPDLPSPGSQ